MFNQGCLRLHPAARASVIRNGLPGAFLSKAGVPRRETGPRGPVQPSRAILAGTAGDRLHGAGKRAECDAL